MGASLLGLQAWIFYLIKTWLLPVLAIMPMILSTLPS